MANNISSTAVIMSDVVLGDNVVIGDHVYIDHGAIIRDNVTIGGGTYVGPRCTLGEYLFDFYRDRTNKCHPLTIGADSLIRSGTVIYGETVIGDHFQTGHNATVREHTVIGHHSRIGSYSDVLGHNRIGNYSCLHSGVLMAPETEIGDYVWIMPRVVFTDDPTPPSMVSHGTVVEDYAVVAAASVITPGRRIGTGALIGAGAVVTKDVPAGKVFVGNPARCLCDTTAVMDKETGKHAYPWPESFERGMPWQGIGYEQWRKQQAEK